MTEWDSPIRVALAYQEHEFSDQLHARITKYYDIDVDKEHLMKILYDAHSEWVRGYQQGQYDANKHSHWVHMSDADGDYWECHECGEILPRHGDTPTYDNPCPALTSIEPTRFCPACGADMVK